jgi:L-histidine N-alpha-methyltransferase
MLAEVAAGLSAPQKELPPKYFYDHRGSELFEEITRLPEYYPTRTERRLLESWMPTLIAEQGTRSLVELGAGSAEKSRIILRAMQALGSAGVYVPVDVSASFLNQTAAQLRREYPGLVVEPLVADIAEEFVVPSAIPHPALYAFLGGTIGNFYPPAAIRLLGRVRTAMRPGDRFLMGVDLRKSVGRI